MIYVPNLNYECYVVINADTIRAYEKKPYNADYQGQQVTINYRDYYINSNYLYKDSYENFSYYSQLPVCLEAKNLTDEYFYRNDFDRICIIILIMAIFTIYIPLKVVLRFFRRFQ